MTFETWLRQHNYEPDTVRVTMRHASSAEKLLAAGVRAGDLPQTTRYAARRFATYLRDEGRSAELEHWTQAGVRPLDRAPKAKAKRRQHDAVSIEPEQWRALGDVVWGAEQPEAYALRCMMSTGLRVGEVLRVDRDDLSAALQTGRLSLRRKGGHYQEVPIEGARESWQTLHDALRRAGAGTVAALVCPDNPSPLAGDAAYKRVSRALGRFIRQAGVGGRANTHRLRRTMAVMALNATDNLVVVQQMLGHANITSTQHYTDELHVDRIADLQRKLGREK